MINALPPAPQLPAPEYGQPPAPEYGQPPAPQPPAPEYGQPPQAPAAQVEVIALDYGIKYSFEECFISV